MLRLRGATSSVDDLTSGSFEPVIDDARITDKGAVTKVLLHAGKLHYDLASELQKNPDEKIALVRIEQFYPLPIEELSAVTSSYPNAELVWVQDEPQNQGAWPFICTEIGSRLDGRAISVVSRPAAASPAAGSAKRHAVEQSELIARALSGASWGVTRKTGGAPSGVPPVFA